ncbi:MAG: nucleobase:cation symporter, family, partial [Verrucomicrobiota bacterium]
MFVSGLQISVGENHAAAHALDRFGDEPGALAGRRIIDQALYVGGILAAGVGIVALASLLVAILPNLPGFLVTVKLIDAGSVPVFFVTLYSYAWFVGFAIAFGLYLILRMLGAEERPLKRMSS